MFAPAYFAPTFFAPVYFPPGADAEAPVILPPHRDQQGGARPGLTRKDREAARRLREEGELNMIVSILAAMWDEFDEH